MNKTIFASALLLAAWGAHAQGNEMAYSVQVKGVVHTLKLTNWKHGVKGAVSFDYQYEQSGNQCTLSLQGHADTVLDDSGAPEVYNAEDGKGGEEQLIGVEGGPLSFSFPYHLKSLKPPGKSIVMTLSVDAAMKKAACTKKEGRHDFKLKKAA